MQLSWSVNKAVLEVREDAAQTTISYRDAVVARGSSVPDALVDLVSAHIRAPVRVVVTNRDGAVVRTCNTAPIPLERQRVPALLPAEPFGEIEIRIDVATLFVEASASSSSNAPTHQRRRRSVEPSIITKPLAPCARPPGNGLIFALSGSSGAWSARAAISRVNRSAAFDDDPWGAPRVDVAVCVRDGTFHVAAAEHATGAPSAERHDGRRRIAPSDIARAHRAWDGIAIALSIGGRWAPRGGTHVRRSALVCAGKTDAVVSGVAVAAGGGARAVASTGGGAKRAQPEERARTTVLQLLVHRGCSCLVLPGSSFARVITLNVELACAGFHPLVNTKTRTETSFATMPIAVGESPTIICAAQGELAAVRITEGDSDVGAVRIETPSSVPLTTNELVGKTIIAARVLPRSLAELTQHRSVVVAPARAPAEYDEEDAELTRMVRHASFTTPLRIVRGRGIFAGGAQVTAGRVAARVGSIHLLPDGDVVMIERDVLYPTLWVAKITDAKLTDARKIFRIKLPGQRFGAARPTADGRMLVPIFEE